MVSPRAKPWYSALPVYSLVGAQPDLDPQPHATSGFRLGSFEAIEEIGYGGMGDIWRGSHAGQAVPVAIKVIRKETADDPDFRKVFRREVRVVARLDHPGIITLFDIGEVSEDTAR